MPHPHYSVLHYRLPSYILGHHYTTPFCTSPFQGLEILCCSSPGFRPSAFTLGWWVRCPCRAEKPVSDSMHAIRDITAQPGFPHESVLDLIGDGNDSTRSLPVAYTDAPHTHYEQLPKSKLVTPLKHKERRLALLWVFCSILTLSALPFCWLHREGCRLSRIAYRCRAGYDVRHRRRRFGVRFRL